MYIPDPIERGEARMEDWAFDAVTGDSFVCSCGATCRLDQGETCSADPYAIPVCQKCFGEWMDEHEIKTLDTPEPDAVN